MVIDDSKVEGEREARTIRQKYFSDGAPVLVFNRQECNLGLRRKQKGIGMCSNKLLLPRAMK